jgi:hypothetical protein
MTSYRKVAARKNPLFRRLFWMTRAWTKPLRETGRRERVAPLRQFLTTDAIVLTLGCFAVALLHATSQSWNGPVRIEETKRFALSSIINEYKSPSPHRPSFDVSADQKYLVLPVWIRGADGRCQSDPSCGAYAMGLIDTSKGELAVRSRELETSWPAVLAFDPNAPDIITTRENAIVLLDSRTLIELGRLDSSKFIPPDLGPSHLLGVALSRDAKRVAGIYLADPIESNKGAQNTTWVTYVVTFDLRNPADVTRCALEEGKGIPSPTSIALASDGRSVLYTSQPGLNGDRNLVYYDSRSCSVLRSWNFQEAVTAAEFSADDAYMAVLFGGLHPTVKVRVFRASDGKELWNVPSQSGNDEGWQFSISPNSQWLAISTDRYGETWLDAIRETSHIDTPGVEILDLRTGHALGGVRFGTRTASTADFSFGTKMVRFTSQNDLIVLSPDSTLHFYRLSVSDSSSPTH